MSRFKINTSLGKLADWFLFLGFVGWLPALIFLAIGWEQVYQINAAINISLVGIVFLVAIFESLLNGTKKLFRYFHKKLSAGKDDDNLFQAFEERFGMGLERAFNIIGDYGATVEEFYGGQLANDEFKMKLPESQLPHSRDDIRRACLMLYILLRNEKIKRELGKTNNDFTKNILTKEFHEQLRTGYYLLSECLPDKEAHLCNRYFQSVLNPDIRMTDREIDKVQKILKRTKEDGHRLLDDLKKLKVQA